MGEKEKQKPEAFGLPPRSRVTKRESLQIMGPFFRHAVFMVISVFPPHKSNQNPLKPP